MAQRYWPLARGHIITSGFGARWGTTHWGTDFGWDGGSGGRPVYAVQAGTVWAVGPASGFGQWVVVDHPTEAGGGTTVYGHVIPLVSVGESVEAGEVIARINPDSTSNGGVPPHLHLEWHRYVWSPPGSDRLDPLPLLEGAAYPGEETTVTPTTALDVDTLAGAMGERVSRERYAELLPAFAEAMRLAGCTTQLRAQMWCAQIGHESGGLRWMAEIADGSAYEGRGDLGNTEPGDGRRFKGRGPIQVTGRYNYTRLSLWAHSKGYVPTPTFFVDNPGELESPRYGFLGAVWYWTVARDMNAIIDDPNMDDEQTLRAATRAVNGGLNGLDDRRAFWQRARNYGARLLPGDTEEDGVARRRSLIDPSKEFEGTEFDQFIDYHVNKLREQVADLSAKMDAILKAVTK